MLGRGLGQARLISEPMLAYFMAAGYTHAVFEPTDGEFPQWIGMAVWHNPHFSKFAYLKCLSESPFKNWGNRQRATEADR